MPQLLLPEACDLWLSPAEKERQRRLLAPLQPDRPVGDLLRLAVREWLRCKVVEHYLRSLWSL